MTQPALTPPTDERRRQLAELAAWHHEWVMAALDDAPFRPEGRKAGSDYNQHYVDIDADDDVFHRRAAQIMGIDRTSD